MTYLTGRYGTAANGGVKYYNLDNEPDIWHSTHRDVHPTGAGYDEMRDRTIDIAGAIKKADPGAQTLGPTGWGWSSITLAGSDQQTCGASARCWSNPPDKAAHGGTDFGAWYLAQLKAYDTAHGTRLLDYYDNHWYPQESASVRNGNDPTTKALRLRSTRNLWDPTYVDETWINQPDAAHPPDEGARGAELPGHQDGHHRVQLGRAGQHQRRARAGRHLGIFGREGLDLANLWSPPTAPQPGATRSGCSVTTTGRAGGRHTSVKASSADQDKLAVYATRDATGRSSSSSSTRPATT